MAITSEDIQNQSFSIDRKGYDVDEVDVFLEHVAAEIDELNAIIADLQAAAEAPQYYETDEIEMDMDAAFAEPAMPVEVDEPVESADVADLRNQIAERDARIAQLERELEENANDASAISDALVTAQRSAKEVVARAKVDAEQIIANAENDAAEILEKANAERDKIEVDIEELDRTHDEACDIYSTSLRDFIEDASRKLADIERAKGAARAAGKSAGHSRFNGKDQQAPIRKPEAVKPEPAPAKATPIVQPVTIRTSVVEKDLSGFGVSAGDMGFDDMD